MRKDLSYSKNIVFCILITVVAVIKIVINAFFPDIMLPSVSIPMLVLLVAISEIISTYLKLEDDGCILVSAVLGGLTTVLLHFSFLLTVLGVVIYFVVDYIYTSMNSRMKSGKMTVLSPVVNGLMLYLAVQALQGLI